MIEIILVCCLFFLVFTVYKSIELMDYFLI